MNKIEKRPIRLVGISLSGLSETPNMQISLFNSEKDEQQDKLTDAMMKIQKIYGRRIIKTTGQLRAGKRVHEEDITHN